MIRYIIEYDMIQYNMIIYTYPLMVGQLALAAFLLDTRKPTSSKRQRCEKHNGPSAGALDAESPQSKKQEDEKVFWSRNMCFSYGLARYSACAKMYTFPMVPAYSQAA